MFHIDRRNGYSVGLGVVPAANTASTGPAWNVGYMFYSSGSYYAKRNWPIADYGGVGFDTGDTIAVRLDLDTNTITFRKNGADVAAPEKMVSPKSHEREYYLAFDAEAKGSAVTIIEMI